MMRWMMALVLALTCITTAQAAQRGGMPRNDCATFYARQQGESYDVVAVDIVGVTQGVVGVRILGLPRKVIATVNGRSRRWTVARLCAGARPWASTRSMT